MSSDGGITGGQTVGPFFGYGLPYPKGDELVSPHSHGAVHLSGVVFDGAGEPVPDALIEIWQPDGVTFTGFGRAATDAEGRYRFWTVEPGIPQGSASAPFLAVAVFARGLLDRLHTRIYLPENEEALEHDPLLAALESSERETLIARRSSDGALVHDIRLQGARETVFLVYR